MKIAIQIPLNPPLLKGDFNSPLRKRGVGGDFHPSKLPTPGMRDLYYYSKKSPVISQLFIIA